MKLMVNEIFESIQGEGGRSGQLSIFIRLAGCNLKCSFCSMRHSWARRIPGFMSLGLIDLINWSDSDYVELQLLGEPTLHPQIEEIIDKLKEKGVQVGFSSNYARPDVLMNVVDKCKMITINDYDKKGIDPFLANHPNVRLQCVGGDFPVEDYTHTTKYGLQNICRIPYNYVSIQWDGDIVPCPRAHGKQVVFGNLYNQTWNEIVNGDKFMQFKQNLLLKKDNRLCEYCWAPNCESCRYMFFKNEFGEDSYKLRTWEYLDWKKRIDERME